MYHFKSLKSLHASVLFSLKNKIHMTKATIKSRPTSRWLSLQWRLGLPTSILRILFPFKYKIGGIHEFYSYFLKRESRKERNKEGRKERNVSSQEAPSSPPQLLQRFPSIHTHWRGRPSKQHGSHKAYV